MPRKLSVLVASVLFVLASALPAAAADYTVRAGDTLSKIARAQNVDGGWQAIYNANRDVLSNPNVIRVGQVLDLPGGERAARAERASRSSSSSVGEQVVAAARSQIGVMYRYGGNSPSEGFDCSGLTSWAYAQAGEKIPRVSRSQIAAATKVSNPQPGDLVAYYSPVSHVGIYVGGGKMIHSSRPGQPVKEVNVYSSGLRGYYRP